LEEGRLILPGIQALFGFQLIAVFNEPFYRLSQFNQELHLLAVILSMVSIGLAMTPAALRRQVEPSRVTQNLLNRLSRILSLSLVPLMFGFALDIYILFQVVLSNVLISAVVGVLAFLLLAGMWFAYPRYCQTSNRTG